MLWGCRRGYQHVVLQSLDDGEVVRLIGGLCVDIAECKSEDGDAFFGPETLGFFCKLFTSRYLQPQVDQCGDFVYANMAQVLDERVLQTPPDIWRHDICAKQVMFSVVGEDTGIPKLVRDLWRAGNCDDELLEHGQLDGIMRRFPSEVSARAFLVVLDSIGSPPRQDSLLQRGRVGSRSVGRGLAYICACLE